MRGYAYGPLRSGVAGMVLGLLLVAACRGQDAVVPQTADPAWVTLITTLSEPGGYFDTDNLISNESSYLHVLDALRAQGLRGGTYLGVGPGQNFSYIARIRPTQAFILDIRRDNLLQHLWYKALFQLAPNREAYLALMLGKPYEGVPADTSWSIDILLAHLDAIPTTPAAVAAARERVQVQVQHFGLALSEADLKTIDAIHERFIRYGLDLQFTSHGRAPMPYYPTLRDLFLERDRRGQYGNYLAREADYQYVRHLQEADRIVPLVGNLGGAHALAAVGQHLRAQGETVSAFYTSNVEFYLMRNRQFDRFAQTVAALPFDDESVFIRSYFSRFRYPHPETVVGYVSTQLLQPIHRFVEGYQEGGFRRYYDLVNDAVLEER